MKRFDWRVHAALIFIQFSFGGFHVFGKYVLEHFDPLAVAAIRVMGAAPILFLLGLRAHPAIPERRDLWRLALLGLLGVFTNQILFVVGLQRTTATNAAILMPSIPVFVALLGASLGVERMGAAKWLGVFVSVAGAMVMLGLGGFSMAPAVMIGNVLILVNCASYSLYLVLMRPLLLRLHALTVVGWAFFFGGLGVVAVGMPSVAALHSLAVPGLVWLGMGYIIVVPTIINYALNVWAVGRTSPALVATYTTLQPVAAALLAAFFLGEAAGLREAIGFALIVAGLIRVSMAHRGEASR